MKIAIALAIALLATPALAQTPKPRPALTGNIFRDIKTGVENQEAQTVTDIETALQKFGDFIGTDMTGAADLAISIPGLQDGNGQICFDAMSNASKVFQTNPIPKASSDMPPIGIAMIMERLRLLAMTVNNVCNIPACTQIFADATGALAAAAPLKTPIPSLHDLCSNIPNIAVAKPTRVLQTSPISATPINPQ